MAGTGFLNALSSARISFAICVWRMEGIGDKTRVGGWNGGWLCLLEEREEIVFVLRGWGLAWKNVRIG